MSLLRPSGARPMPKRATAAASIPRFLRYSRASAPSMPCKLLGEPFLARRHDVSQRGRALGAFAGLRVGGGDFEPGLGRELLHRVHERQAALVGQEADRVAVRAAAEAMVEALLVVDREAGRLLVVERAAGLPLAARADELHRRRDDRGQHGPGAKLVEPGGVEGHRRTDFLARTRTAASAGQGLIHRLSGLDCAGEDLTMPASAGIDTIISPRGMSGNRVNLLCSELQRRRAAARND